MTVCESVRKELSDYLLGSLSPRRAGAVEEHLAVCGECLREKLRLETVGAMLDSLQPLEPPAGLWNGVLNRISELQPQPGFWDIRGWTWPRRAIAGAVAAAALIAVGLLTLGPPALTPVEPDAVTQEYIRGHALLASQDPFADKVSLAYLAEVAKGTGDTQ